MIIPQIGIFFNSYFHIFIQILFPCRIKSKGCDLLAPIFIRTLLIYVILILAMRLSGKRQIGEMQLSELVTTFLLSEIASAPLTDPATPLLHAVIPIFTIISLEIILSFLTTKCATAKKLLDDKPSIIIQNGTLRVSEMSRIRLSMDDLLCELRQKSISSVSEVDYAILEPNGKISVFKKEDPPLSHALIIDGILQRDALIKAKRSEAWVLNILRGQGIDRIDGIFLFCATDNGSITLIRKGDCE